jgi:hypothetical protein
MSVDNAINTIAVLLSKLRSVHFWIRNKAQAIGLWQEKYASQATFSVQYFVRECVRFGVEWNHSAIS